MRRPDGLPAAGLGAPECDAEIELPGLALAHRERPLLGRPVHRKRLGANHLRDDAK